MHREQKSYTGCTGSSHSDILTHTDTDTPTHIDTHTDTHGYTHTQIRNAPLRHSMECVTYICDMTIVCYMNHMRDIAHMCEMAHSHSHSHRHRHEHAHERGHKHRHSDTQWIHTHTDTKRTTETHISVMQMRNVRIMSYK